MILGNVCTRPCGFCSVPKGKTEALAADEPERVAEAALRLALKHVVITSVTRDDLPDGGAEHFYRSVLAVRARTGAVVEVLTPDFIGKPGRIERVVEAAPEVFNHNTETVPRLYRTVRGRKSVYRWTLQLLDRVKRLNPAIKTKSGLMLGLGETHQEVLDTLADLRDARARLSDARPIPASHPRALAGRALSAAGRIRRTGPASPPHRFRASGQRPVRPLELSRPRNGRRGGGLTAAMRPAVGCVSTHHLSRLQHAGHRASRRAAPPKTPPR